MTNTDDRGVPIGQVIRLADDVQQAVDAAVKDSVAVNMYITRATRVAGLCVRVDTTLDGNLRTTLLPVRKLVGVSGQTLRDYVASRLPRMVLRSGGGR